MNILGKLFIGAVSLGAAAIATNILMKKKRESHDARYSDDLPLHGDCCGTCGEDCCCNADESADDCCCEGEQCSCQTTETPASDAAPAPKTQTEDVSEPSEDAAEDSTQTRTEPESNNN